MKKNKSILNTSLLFCGIVLFCLNLVSCNNTNKEFIEVGLSNEYNNCEYNPWNEFYTGLKAKTQ